MPISGQLIQSRGTAREVGSRADALEAPFEKVNRIAAAGSIALVDAAEIFLYQNKGDAVYARIRKVADAATQPAADNDKSVKLETGDELPFGLPANTSAAAYELAIAAA